MPAERVGKALRSPLVWLLVLVVWLPSRVKAAPWGGLGFVPDGECSCTPEEAVLLLRSRPCCLPSARLMPACFRLLRLAPCCSPPCPGAGQRRIQAQLSASPHGAALAARRVGACCSGRFLAVQQHLAPAPELGRWSFCGCRACSLPAESRGKGRQMDSGDALRQAGAGLCLDHNFVAGQDTAQAAQFSDFSKTPAGEVLW